MTNCSGRRDALGDVAVEARRSSPTPEIVCQGGTAIPSRVPVSTRRPKITVPVPLTAMAASSRRAWPIDPQDRGSFIPDEGPARRLFYRFLPAAAGRWPKGGGFRPGRDRNARARDETTGGSSGSAGHVFRGPLDRPRTIPTPPKTSCVPGPRERGGGLPRRARAIIYHEGRSGSPAPTAERERKGRSGAMTRASTA